jgi:protein involved in polysaccharide export with SLBB domain
MAARIDLRSEGARRLTPSLALGCALLLAACESAGGPSLSRIAERVNATLDPKSIVLAVGDEIEVRFAYAPTWNQTVVIAADGSAAFLAIDRLIAAGTTPAKLGQTLGDAYQHVLDNAELDVVVRALGARNVYVFGEVSKPGELVLGPDRRLSLVEALARAGGPKKETAYLAHTLLVRWSADTNTQLHWTIDARPEHWTGATPLYLQPYDVVYIPNTPVDAVAIWVDNYIRRMIPFPYLFTPIQ